jgi:uncharacterized protein YlxW (UPF0749 family)
MKVLIASLVCALVLAGGAGAYNMAVTPRQFAALKAQVASLQRKVADLQSTTSALQSTVNSSSSTVTCLQKNWNAVTLWSSDIYAINSNKYDAGTVGQLNTQSILMAPLPTATQC